MDVTAAVCFDDRQPSVFCAAYSAYYLLKPSAPET